MAVSFVRPQCIKWWSVDQLTMVTVFEMHYGRMAHLSSTHTVCHFEIWQYATSAEPGFNSGVTVLKFPLVVIIGRSCGKPRFLICGLGFLMKSVPSVLWCCWLGGSKSVRSVKIWSDGVLAWLSVWSEVQMLMPLWHCHPVISCFSKIQNGLFFWYQPTHFVLEKGH